MLTFSDTLSSGLVSQAGLFSPPLRTGTNFYISPLPLPIPTPNNSSYPNGKTTILPSTALPTTSNPPSALMGTVPLHSTLAPYHSKTAAPPQPASKSHLGTAFSRSTPIASALMRTTTMCALATTPTNPIYCEA